MAQADAAQAVDQNIGHGGEPHAQLIGRHGGGRRPIGKQFELLADAVPGRSRGLRRARAPRSGCVPVPIGEWRREWQHADGCGGTYLADSRTSVCHGCMIRRDASHASVKSNGVCGAYSSQPRTMRPFHPLSRPALRSAWSPRSWKHCFGRNDRKSSYSEV
jgi:hypothetical protein